MENPPAQRRRMNNIHRPQIYVHVEFGVSWSQRHAPNNHGVTYRSRGLRERAPNFPRQVPPPNTNYLTAPSHDHPRSNNHPYLPQYQQQHHQHQNNNHHHHHHNPQQHRQEPHRSHQQPHREADRSRHLLGAGGGGGGGGGRGNHDEADDDGRSSRDSRSSHERGRSAPPPINNSPWDISTLEGSGMPPTSSRAQAAGAGATSAEPRAAAAAAEPRIWKDLPETPSRYRLGEAGMPWSSWSWPMGYEPEVDPDDSRLSPSEYPSASAAATATAAAAVAATVSAPDEGVYSYDGGYSYGSYASSGGGGGYEHHEGGRALSASATSPTVYSTTHGLTLEVPRYPEVERARTRELEALSAAMMTVDNGFENQWWNQGQREMTAAAEPAPAAAAAAAAMGATLSPVAGPRNPGPSPVVDTPLHHQRLVSATSLGWAIADESRTHHHYSSPSTLNQLVSPITARDLEYYSPPPVYQQLSRTMSTRSEELFLVGDRYA